MIAQHALGCQHVVRLREEVDEVRLLPPVHSHPYNPELAGGAGIARWPRREAAGFSVRVH
jgi:hypothetical protein